MMNDAIRAWRRPKAAPRKVGEPSAAVNDTVRRMISPVIDLRRITKTYDSGGLATTVLRGISLTIHDGEFVALMGQSGSGKTTLMNLIGCLDRASSGTYLFEGHDVSSLDADELAALRRHSFGFIFQRYNLIGTETATENVEIPAIYAGLPGRERLSRARALLTRLGLADRLEYRPNQLSGGQQQRVSIARALMNGGRVILADEPTGALDSASGAEVLAQLKELHRAGHTVILVTHEQSIAATADRVIQLKDGCVIADSGTVARGRPAFIAGGIHAERSNRWLPDLVEAAKMALRALRSNMFRTALTLLGIIIGVGAVVTMLALGDGSKRVVLSRIEAMGTDLLVVRPGGQKVRSRDEWISLVPPDAAAIAELPEVLHSVPEYGSSVTLRYGSIDYMTFGIGTTENYAAARNWPAARGAFFSEADFQRYAPAAVLGRTVADNLFPSEVDPIGQYVLINNISFQVVGVLAAKGANVSGGDLDDNVFMPLTTANMRLWARRHLRAITVQVADQKQMAAAERAIHALLLARHGKEDFQIRNMASLLETHTETQNMLTLLLGSIAAISLLVGGIGVMNIMLVSVTERVREIGVRMATGAQMTHILLQFLTEALVVCALGGLIGVACGLVAAWVAGQMGSPVEYSLTPILLAFGSAFAIGMLFGYLPARRAARLDPEVALAAE
jgi:macrolide transport system ATP-binding/permease protein